MIRYFPAFQLGFPQMTLMMLVSLVPVIINVLWRETLIAERIRIIRKDESRKREGSALLHAGSSLYLETGKVLDGRPPLREMLMAKTTSRIPGMLLTEKV